jgi:Tfp pilus assembly protein PilV
MIKSKHAKGFTVVEILLVLIFVALVVLTGLYVMHNHKTSSSNKASNTTTTSSTKATSTSKSTDPYAGWKTYTSTTEKASFKYPSNWTVTKAASQPSISSADSVGVQSPSGAILVSWVSDVGGVGGECDSTILLGSSSDNGAGAPCPQINVASKTSIAGAPDLFVVAGSVTGDGKTYQSWMAVQGSNGVLVTGRGILFQLFTGKNNGGDNVAFHVAGTGAGWTSAAYSSVAQAEAVLNGAEAQQAKLILLSLTY